MPRARKTKMIKFPPPEQEKESNVQAMPGAGEDVQASI